MSLLKALSQNSIPARKWLLIDCCLALSGALIYLLGFEVLTEVFKIPHWIATTQLFANFIYGIYGLGLFISKSPRMMLFSFLILMNTAYETVCLGLSVLLLESGAPFGGMLLLAEALLIGGLSYFENRRVKTELKQA